MNKREIRRHARRIVECAISKGLWEGTFDLEGNAYQSQFLGTVFAITPSGKYYTPFASSNVDPCPRCRGKTYPCAYCGGLGSREAYEDELFYAALDEYASAAGCWIENGEGDPCDLFICRHVEEEQDE